MRAKLFWLLICCHPAVAADNPIAALDNVKNSLQQPAAPFKGLLQVPNAERADNLQDANPMSQSRLSLFRVVLEPYYRTPLSPVLLRPVDKVNYRMGDRFNDKEVLIQLDNVQNLALVAKAKAALQKAQADFDSKKELYRRDLSSEFEYREAEAALALAKADLIIAQDNLKKTQIIAPYDGRVVDLYIEEGEYPKENTQVIEVIDDSIIRAKFLLPSRYLKYVKVGEPIDIDIIELGRKVKGTITRTGAIIDPSSSTIKIEAEIDNPKHDLIPGMTGFVTLKSLRGGAS